MKGLPSSKEGDPAGICLVLQAHALHCSQSLQMPTERQTQQLSESPGLEGLFFRPCFPLAPFPSLVVSRAGAGGRHHPKTCSVPPSPSWMGLTSCPVLPVPIHLELAFTAPAKKAFHPLIIPPPQPQRGGDFKVSGPSLISSLQQLSHKQRQEGKVAPLSSGSTSAGGVVICP